MPLDAVVNQTDSSAAPRPRTKKRKRSQQDTIYESIVNNVKVGRLGRGRYHVGWMEDNNFEFWLSRVACLGAPVTKSWSIHSAGGVTPVSRKEQLTLQFLGKHSRSWTIDLGYCPTLLVTGTPLTLTVLVSCGVPHPCLNARKFIWWLVYDWFMEEK